MTATTDDQSWDHSVPDEALVELTHASVDAVATSHGIPVLHIDGADSARNAGLDHHVSTEVGVVVHCDDAVTYIKALHAAGWTEDVPADGSQIQGGQPATLHHGVWQTTVVLCRNPQVVVDTPGDWFDRLWNQRSRRRLAGRWCAIPGAPGQPASLVQQWLGHLPTPVASAPFDVAAVTCPLVQATYVARVPEGPIHVLSGVASVVWEELQHGRSTPSSVVEALSARDIEISGDRVVGLMRYLERQALRPPRGSAERGPDR